MSDKFFIVVYQDFAFGQTWWHINMPLFLTKESADARAKYLVDKEGAWRAHVIPLDMTLRHYRQMCLADIM